MCMFIMYPFYTILTKSVFSNKVDGITLYNFKRFFTKPYYYQTLIRSMVVVLRHRPHNHHRRRSHRVSYDALQHPRQKVLHIFIIMSLMSPPFIGAYSWIILLGRAGLLAKLFAKIGLVAPTIYGRGGIIFVFCRTYSRTSTSTPRVR